MGQTKGNHSKTTIKKSIKKWIELAESNGICEGTFLTRLNITAYKTFHRSAKNSKITLDTYGDREINFKKKAFKYAAKYDENREYYKLVELIFDNNCKNCNHDGYKCDIYKEFEEQRIYEFDGTDKCTNCRYSFKG